MDPNEISRLAENERKKQAKEEKKAKESAGKEPFNPFDWMDFKNTRQWMKNNLALGDWFYSIQVSILLGAGLVTWFYIQDGGKLMYYLMIIGWAMFVVYSVVGFVYGYMKARKNRIVK